MSYKPHYKKVEVSTSPLTLTTSFQDLGSEISCLGFRTMTLFLQIDINDANDVVIAPLGKLSQGATAEYGFPLQIEGTAEKNVDNLEFEINADEDQYIMLRFSIEGVPFVQLQALERTDGGGDADIEHCYAMLTA
jgi:hypothetical protein